MRFMFWSTGRRPGQEVASRVKSLSLATLLAVLGLAAGARDVQAQANPAQILEAGAAATTPSGTPAAREEAGDPVSRFLADKGLLNTRPVSELAQQVRDKATDLASDLVISAMDFLGVPYRRGGDSKSEVSTAAASPAMCSNAASA